MQNLELRRRALEATGWRIDVEPDGTMLGKNPANQAWGFAPAVESDPGAFWPWFEALRLENRWCVDITIGGASTGVPAVGFAIYNPTREYIIASDHGPSVEIAGCLAVIAASEKG